MKQILQSFASGEITLADVPAPVVGTGEVLVANRASLISAGTERMLVEFGRAGLISKARQQPDRVRQVLRKVRTDGLSATTRAVRSKLNTPIPMGYSSAGMVIEVGGRVVGISTGDRVATNGPHAEIVAVQSHLCARVPDGVPIETACYTTVASIALQGIRLVAPTLGETVVVSGLGLIGLLAVQILRANGCHVIGVDFVADRLERAVAFGATVVDLAADPDPVNRVHATTAGRGADAVLIATATDRADPVQQAARMCRQRGRIVLVGTAGLSFDRAELYAKELTFQVSCSYGPGRYDPDYEVHGRDYPAGLVRWTEQRNFEAILGLMTSAAIDTKPLTTHRFDIEEAKAAYTAVVDDPASLGVVLSYPERDPAQPVVRRVQVGVAHASAGTGGVPRVAVLGAGNFATQVLVPAIADAGARCVEIVSARGASAAHLATRFGFDRAATDTQTALAADDIDTVFVATRHDLHAELVVAAIEAGKHVYAEKPLAITMAGLADIRAALAGAGDQAPHLMVGFNRRFAPLVVRLRAALDRHPGPKAVVYTVNPGAIPADHWTQDPEVGGGRIVGEACHMIDLLRSLVGTAITSWEAVRFGAADASGVVDDKATMTLRFDDGSIGTVHYLANGAASFPKERIEVFAGGAVYQLDNFRRLRSFGAGAARGAGGRSQDKGHAACVAAFLSAVRGSVPVIPPAELFEVSEVVIRIADGLRQAPVTRGPADS